MGSATSVRLQEAAQLHKRGALAEAASCYRQVLRNEPQNVDALYCLAVIGCQQGRFLEGIDLVRQALAMDPRHARAHNVLGLALSRLGRSAEALASFDAAIVEQPDFADAHGNRAGVLSELGRGIEALESYDRAVALAPDLPQDWCNRGVTLQELGRYSEAIASYDRAIALWPDFAAAHFNRGNALALSGDYDAALAGYERVLAVDPRNTVALNGRGNVFRKLGRPMEALASFQSALAIAPDHVGALLNCGNMLHGLSRHDEALACYDKVLAAEPNHTEALHNRAVTLSENKRYDEALLSYDRVLVLDPAHVAALHHRGQVLAALERPTEALASYDRLLAIKPDHVETLCNRGNAAFALNRLGEALASYDRLLAIKPDHLEALCNRGSAAFALDRLGEALASYDRVLAINPQHLDALCGRGNTLLKLDRPAAALTSYDAVLARAPDHAEALDNRAAALLELGRCKEAVASLRRALALAPNPSRHTALIFTLNFDPELTTADLQAERARWNEAYAKQFASRISPHSNERNPARRLRVGYVSAHFRRQAGIYAFGGVLLTHSADEFELVCYSDTANADDVTARLRARADRWHDTAALSDDALAELIRADGIDILVDLVGHMSGNRLLVFARKPAPIQVSAWGEPTGTGLTTMDYLLADLLLVPAAERPLLAEEVSDLPNFLGYWTPDALPEPSALPAIANGYVTFGSFNRLAKIGDPVLRRWAKILRALPKARLVIKADQLLGDGSRRARIEAVLGEESVDGGRVTLIGRVARADHFAAYRGIDLALDPFPHGGGMTTLDALWMGVPVVTCPGQTISSRLAAASLRALGLTDWIAADPDAYVALAIAKASELDGLARLRAGLRGRMADSVVGDPRRYTREVEAAYRGMWRRWCAGATEGAAIERVSGLRAPL
jgi:protein O-GlcNAc transferase